MRNRVAMAIGAVTFALLQIIWSLGHAYGGWRGAWIMKAGTGFAACFAVFLVIGAVVVAHRPRAGDLFRRTGSVVLGAIVAMVIALIIVGPGSLWPLVIALDGMVLGAAALLGGVIGTALGGKHWRSGRP
jgi:hypothetical protein